MEEPSDWEGSQTDGDSGLLCRRDPSSALVISDVPVVKSDAPPLFLHDYTSILPPGQSWRPKLRAETVRVTLERGQSMM